MVGEQSPTISVSRSSMPKHTKKKTHKMPDGTMMAGAKHKVVKKSAKSKKKAY